MSKVLVVDDEAGIREKLAEVLEREGFVPITAESAEAALERARAETPTVILLDRQMPGRGALEILPELKAIDPRVPVIMLAAPDDIPSVVQAMLLGAYDYLTKPANTEAVVHAVKRAAERFDLLREVEDLRGQVGVAGTLRAQMGPSRQVQEIIEQVARVATSDFTVLLEGETGTGKEVVARAIHHQSARRDQPFVAVDCGALPETLVEAELLGYEKGAFTGADRRKDGYFVAADGGTLFLDEIGNVPPTAQAKLLRALQERMIQVVGGKQAIAVDVRVIAATNASLAGALAGGRFRQDLYYRLCEFTIRLPPLRERLDDVSYLAQRFLEEAAMELRRSVRGIAADTLEALARHDWPGNVRQLRNVVRQALLRSDGWIRPEHLANGVVTTLADDLLPSAPAPVGASLRELARLATAGAERHAIVAALRASGGNKTKAARALRVDYKTLHLKMRAYRIPPKPAPDERRS